MDLKRKASPVSEAGVTDYAHDNAVIPTKQVAARPYVSEETLKLINEKEVEGRTMMDQSPYAWQHKPTTRTIDLIYKTYRESHWKPHVSQAHLKAVYQSLTEIASDNNETKNQWFPASYTSIFNRTGLSRENIREALRMLETLRFIECERRAGQTTRFKLTNMTFGQK